MSEKEPFRTTGGMLHIAQLIYIAIGTTFKFLIAMFCAWLVGYEMTDFVEFVILFGGFVVSTLTSCMLLTVYRLKGWIIVEDKGGKND